MCWRAEPCVLPSKKHHAFGQVTLGLFETWFKYLRSTAMEQGTQPLQVLTLNNQISATVLWIQVAHMMWR